MKCKYMKLKINKGIWCTRDDIECINCNNKEFETPNILNNKSFKNRTSKLNKLERNKFSILTSDLEHCIICGSKRDNLHEVFFGTTNRTNSMIYGYVIL